MNRGTATALPEQVPLLRCRPYQGNELISPRPRCRSQLAGHVVPPGRLSPSQITSGSSTPYRGPPGLDGPGDFFWAAQSHSELGRERLPVDVRLINRECREGLADGVAAGQEGMRLPLRKWRSTRTAGATGAVPGSCGSADGATAPLRSEANVKPRPERPLLTRPALHNQSGIHGSPSWSHQP